MTRHFPPFYHADAGLRQNYEPRDHLRLGMRFLLQRNIGRFSPSIRPMVSYQRFPIPNSSIHSTSFSTTIAIPISTREWENERPSSVASVHENNGFNGYGRIIGGGFGVPRELELDDEPGRWELVNGMMMGNMQALERDSDEELKREIGYDGEERVSVERRGMRLWRRDGNVNFEARMMMHWDLVPGLESWGWGWKGRASNRVLGVSWEDVYWSYASFCAGAVFGGCIGENMVKIGLRWWALSQWVESTIAARTSLAKSIRFRLWSLLAGFVFRATRSW